jgi:hypothetical protein
MIIESQISVTRKHYFFMVNPTVGLQSTVNIIHINNINTNSDGNSHTNVLQCPKADCTHMESEKSSFSE